MSQSWRKYKFKEVASLKTGKLDSNAAVVGGGYPFFTCAPETYAIDTFAFDTTAILLAGNNATGVFPIKFYSGKFNCYQRTYIIEIVSPDLSDLKFLYFALQIQLKFLQSLSIGAATKFLTKRLLDNLLVPLPPLPTQQKIAHILSAYDDLIENNLKRIKLLEEMAQITYEQWFVRLKFPGHETTAIDAETGLPEGWKLGKLDDYVDVVKDTVLPSSLKEVIRYIGLEHMPRKSITLSSYGASEGVTSLKNMVKKGDVLFGKIRPYFHKVGMALEDCISSTDIIVVRPKNDLSGIVMETMFSESFVSMAVQSSNGTKMPRANWNVIKNHKLIIPEKGLSENYQKYFSTLIDSISNLVLQNQRLKEARDILLPRLMTGMINVDHIELPVTKQEIEAA